MKYTVRKARKDEAPRIRQIVETTIREVYTKYYPEEVVQFFLDHHCMENIENDLRKGNVYLICDGEDIIGTGTVDGDSITRLFVLPSYQGKGAGSAMMDFLEAEILRDHGAVWIDSSLPAGEFYRKRHYVPQTHGEHHVANGKILAYEIMCRRDFPIDPDVYNAPSQLVRRELEQQGLDPDEIKARIPARVYLLADSLYDTMLSRKAGTPAFPVGGDLYMMDHDPRIGFVKGEMCSPGIATQAEDLFAAGVQELIHVGFAGGRGDTRIGEYVITDGAYHDTAVAGLYGFHDEIIPSSKELTDAFCREMDAKGLKYRRGYHWTTDAGYVVTDRSIRYYEEKGVKCLEMEGAGLFTVARFRGRKAAGIYVISDSGSGEDWDLGWGEDVLERSIQALIDALIQEG